MLLPFISFISFESFHLPILDISSNEGSIEVMGRDREDNYTTAVLSFRSGTRPRRVTRRRATRRAFSRA